MILLYRRINLPKRKRRDRLKELERASPRESYVEIDVETASEASSEQDYSYEFAQMEVIMKTLGNNGTIRIKKKQHCTTLCFYFTVKTSITVRKTLNEKIQYVPLLVKVLNFKLFSVCE